MIKQKIKDCFDEFKAFAIKGNAIELAVGIVIGTAFNNIVNSLVNDVIMQAIAMGFGKPDFSQLMIGAIKIGNFINAVVNFIIISLSVFITITVMNKLIHHKKKEEPEIQA